MSVVYLESAPGIQTVFFFSFSRFCIPAPLVLKLLLLLVLLYSVTDQQYSPIQGLFISTESETLARTFWWTAFEIGTGNKWLKRTVLDGNRESDQRSSRPEDELDRSTYCVQSRDLLSTIDAQSTRTDYRHPAIYNRHWQVVCATTRLIIFYYVVYIRV